MILYGFIASPYVARVVMFSRLKGGDLPLEAPPGGGPKSAEYLALNPIGKIPGLEVDGRVIGESEVICQYLDDAFPDMAGMPSDPLARAQSRIVSRIVDLYIAPPCSALLGMIPPDRRVRETVDENVMALNQGLDHLARCMGDGPFAAGALPSLGDCAAGPYMKLLQKTAFAHFAAANDPTTGDGRLAEWWNAIQGNQVCKATVDEFGDVFDASLKFLLQHIANS